MHRIYYQPEGVWFGDCMPFFANGEFYLYHQRDTRKPGPFGEPFGWALATTTDFVSYKDHGESLHKGADDDQDQFIFAGSVFEAGGTYYAMYTGYNRDYPEQGKASQVLMIAESEDLVNWRKSDRKLVPPEPGYDPNDWRDPFVLWDEEAKDYLMILGARKAGEKVLTGSTVAFRSDDLQDWRFEGDFWAPGLYSMHEMPDLFRIGDWWYLLTTEYSDKSKTVYRMSKSLDGPWTAPVDDAFDGRAYYAARSATDGEHRYLFGWVPTRTEGLPRGDWEWGGTLVVHEVYQRMDGSLGVAPPAGVRAAFGDSARLDAVQASSAGGVAEHEVATASTDLFRLSGKVKFTAGTRSASIRLFEDAATGQGYEFQLLFGENRLQFDRRPNYPWYRYDNRGLDRPITWEADRNYWFEVIVDGDIATLYVDGVALNTRTTDAPGGSIVLSAVEGTVQFDELELSRGLR